MNKLRVSEAFELYRLEVIVYKNQSHKTEEMNRYACKSFIDFAGDIYLSDLTFDYVRRWKDHLSRARGQNTVRGYVIKLRVVLAHAKLSGYDVMNPQLIGVPKRKTATVEFITPKAVGRLLDCVFKPQNGYSTKNRYRNRAVVSLLYASGIRVSELCSLNRLSIRDDGSFTIIGKGDCSRLCFVDQRTITYINSYLKLRTDSDPALFLSNCTGKRISKDTVQEIFRCASRKAGFEKMVHPHTMRHSFATNLLRNNTNLLYVSKFLGHKSVSTTEMYTHVVDQDLKAIYKQKHTI